MRVQPQSFRKGVAATVPLTLAFLLAILTQIPLGSASAGTPAPNWTLMLVFYFSIHRPSLVPPVAVALVGLFQDFLWGGPPGLNLLILLIAQMVLSDQQAFFVRRSFLVGWLGFVTVAAIAMALSWLAGSLYYGEFLGLRPLAVQTASSVVAYPVAGWVFGRIDGMLGR